MTKRKRKKTVEEIVAKLNLELQSYYPGVDIQIGMIHEGPPVSDNLVLDLQGDNMEELGILSSEIKLIIEDIPGTRNISTSLVRSFSSNCRFTS